MIPVVCALLFSGMGIVAAAPQEYYQSRYDHLDVESVLNNRRMVNYYAACLLSKGPCPPQGVDLKHILPEALATNCAKCTEKQRTAAYRTVKRLRKEYPKIWDQLVAVWDPEDIYVRKFEASFESDKASIIPSASQPESPLIANRFGDDTDSNTIAPPTPTSSTSTTRASTSTTTSATTTTTTSVTTATKLTNRPSLFVTRPPQAPPFTTVGANLQATVSFGTNLVGGIVRGLGNLGSKVVESGTRIANMVFSAALRN